MHVRINKILVLFKKKGRREGEMERWREGRERWREGRDGGRGVRKGKVQPNPS